MYQIKCDDYHLYDYRLPELIVTDPKLKIAVNTVGEASFVIHNEHPYFSKLKVLKSIFEISDEIGVIFRGRMTNNSYDFHNSKAVDLEGLMAFFNDSVVRPFKFPEDFKENAEYITASESGNVVRFFLKWLIDNHNSQVEAFQKFKLGNVTVSDPNNYITRSESKYSSTLEVLKNKLFDSALGGYLCIRYEDDGNYIDYLSAFELTNTQEIQYGENLIDLKNEIDAVNTYSAIIPLGAEVETEETDENGEKIKKTLDLSEIADGTVAPDVMKEGDTIYSISAVQDYGWIYAPVEDTTWSDVTIASRLLNKAIEYLTGDAVKVQNNIEISAVDLHFTDAEIKSFRLYRNVKVNSLPHGQEAVLPLTSLNIDLLKPQNTKIVLGRTQRTLSEITNDRFQSAIDKIQSSTDELKGKYSSTQNSLNDLNAKIEGAIEGTFLYIMFSPYEDGHEMSTDPDENTMYMGTCSTNSATRPTDHTKYTWVKVRGIDGEDGTPGLPGTNQYFHIKYSDDGINFTNNNGEVLGEWMGTCVNNTEDDPTDFDAYTWHRIKGEQGVPGHDGIGIDGTSSYFHIRYSEVSNPTTKDQMTENPSKYIGTYVDNIEDDSDNPADYKWSQFMGEDGIPGTNGTNGQTYYLHIKYSDDGGKTFTANNGETSGKYIGVYTDTTQADSTNVSSYTWSLLKGADGKDGQTTYTWIKYADSPTSGMADNPEGKTYMGIAYNKTTKTESTTYSDYTWSLIKGADGSDGINGTNGTDGKTYYTWVKYADDASGTNMSDDPTNKKYIGLAYNKSTSTESSKASDYQWALFRGEDGVDGTSQYFYIRYSANANGNPMTATPQSTTKYIGVCATTSATAPTSYTDYTWSQCKGDQGVPGATYYTWIKYADDVNGTNMSDNPEGKKYMGFAYNKTTSTESNKASDYTWSLIKGADGSDGINGTNGTDGKTYYTWVKYADDANGTNMTDNPTNKKYIGLAYNKTTSTESNTPSDYQWALFRGADGLDGKTQYFHIKYSDDGINFTSNYGETLGSWIGTYVDFNETDSLVFSDYTWKKFTEDVDEELDDIRQIIENYSTDIVRNTQEITLLAAKEYVETSALNSYKEEVDSKFTQTADSIGMQFTKATTQINNVDGDLQSKFEKISKYIKFNENGIVIGGGANAMTLSLDNDTGIVFSKNGAPFGWWDGIDFHTGNLVVTVNERAQFGDFAFVPRSSGALSFLKVKGDTSSGHTHSYSATVTQAATCTEAGVMAYICSCGDNYTETISALGHTDSNGDGKCDRCGTSYGSCTHSSTYTEYRNAKAATCTTAGTRDKVTICSSCGVTTKTEQETTSEALGHSYNSSGVCTRCGDSSGTPTTNYTVTLIAEPTSGGTVEGGGTYEEGGLMTIKATPNSGYTFDDWYENGVKLNWANEVRNITVDSSRTLTAKFNSTSGGGATGGEQTITEGVTKAVVCSTKNSVVYLKFIPQYTGTYKFESLDCETYDPDGYVYDSSKNLLEGATNSGGFSFDYNFTAGTTYYLGVKLYSSTGTVNVKVSFNGSSGGSSGGGTGEEVEMTVSVNDTSYGTYSVKINGVTATSISTNSYNNANTYKVRVGDSVTLQATLTGGTQFWCWANASTGSQLSSTNPFTFTFDGSQTNIRALFT